MVNFRFYIWILNMEGHNSTHIHTSINSLFQKQDINLGIIFCCNKTQQTSKNPACLPGLENFPMLGETNNQFSLALYLTNSKMFYVYCICNYAAYATLYKKWPIHIISLISNWQCMHVGHRENSITNRLSCIWVLTWYHGS